MCEQTCTIREESQHIEKQWEGGQKIYINLNSICEDWCPATVVRYDGKKVFFRFEEDYNRPIRESFLFLSRWENHCYEKGSESFLIPRVGFNIKERF
jgi:hypothetical protein